MAAAGRHDVNRDPGIKEQGFMCATEIVEPQPWKAQLACAAHELLGQAACVPRASNVLAGGREDQRTVRQLDQGEINSSAVRHTGNQPQVLFAFRRQQRGRHVINGDGATAAACLGFLEPAAVRLRLFKAACDRQCRAAGIEVRPIAGPGFHFDGRQ